MSPSGCLWCGIDKRRHARQWDPRVGWHPWVEPTDEQIKSRLLTRKKEGSS